MVAELAELLLAEPGKLKKLCIFLLKTILNIIFASWIYTKLFGAYHLMEIYNLTNWADFILTGRAFIVLLLYLASHFLLFYVIDSFLFVLVSWMFRPKPAKKIDKTDGNMVIFILRISQLLEIDRKHKQVKLMQHSDDLYDLATFSRNKEGKREINSFKHSLLNEIFNIYTVFLIFYFSNLITIHHSKTISVLIIVGYILILVAYSGISTMIDLLHKIAPDLISLVDTARSEKLIEEFCQEEGIYLHTDSSKKLSFQYFGLNGKNIAIFIMNDPRQLSKGLIDDLLEFGNKEEKLIWIVTTESITPEIEELANKNVEKLKVISYNDGQDLKNKFKKALIIERSLT